MSSPVRWSKFNPVAIRALVLIGVGFIASDIQSAAEVPKYDKVDTAADALAPTNAIRSEEIVRTSRSEADRAREDKDHTEKESQSAAIPEMSHREGEGFDIIAAPLIGFPDSEQLTNFARALRTAKIHQKFGAAEHGNLWEFDLAQRSLNLAVVDAGHVNLPDSESIERIPGGVETQLALMRQSAATTLFGCFPLVRAFGLWPESEEEFEVRSYLRNGDARRHSVYSALNQTGKAASTGPLHTLILVPGHTDDQRMSSLLAKTVDSQADEAFANFANIVVYPGNLRTAVDPMPCWTAPDAAFEPICRQFLKQTNPSKEPRAVMLVLVREFVDEFGDGHWIQAQQRTYEASTLEKAEGKPESLEADKIKVFESLSHDRSRFSGGLWIGVAVLLVVALLIHRVLTAASGTTSGGWQRWIVIPTGGYLIGLGLTPFIMLAMKRWMPDPHANALGAAWWPCIAGSLSLVLPVGVFRLIAGAAGRYIPGFACHGRWGVVFVPVALGVSAAWLAPACYAIGLPCADVVFMIAVAASLIVYCFGRAVDVADEFPIALTPITVGLSLMFGAASFMASPSLLLAVVGLSVLTTAIQILMIRRTNDVTADSDSSKLAPEISPATPRTIEQLRAALRSPRYHAARVFRRFKSSIAASAHEQTHWIGLVGPAAVGKTAAAQLLIDEIQSQQPNLNVLMGRCSENSPPFQPFKEALAKLGASAGIIATNSSMGEVNTIFERLADEFIPFWDFFSVDNDDEEGKESSRHDLFEGVQNVLAKLTQRSAVLLFLDDVQWIDEGSAALLRHLYERFPSGAGEPLTVIVASRDPASIENLEAEVSTLTIEPPSVAEQIHFLQSQFGIEQKSAQRLVRALGVMSEESGNIFWLVRAVGQLVAEDGLLPGTDGFKLRSTYLRDKQLPVPEAIRAKLGAALRDSGQYRPVLECAALLGKKFRVDDVADCLGMDRLLLLQILRHLDQELQLVKDVVNDEECYAFSSEFMLEIVREELGVGSGPSIATRPASKIARELHARIAAVLERRQPRTPQLVCDIARHFHAAGKAYAVKCADYAIAAAETARRQLAFQAARAYLTLAEEGARFTHRSAEIGELLASIETEEANVNHRSRVKPSESAGTAPKYSRRSTIPEKSSPKNPIETPIGT